MLMYATSMDFFGFFFFYTSFSFVQWQPEENRDLTLRFRQTPIEIRPGRYQLGPKLCQAELKNPYVDPLVLVSFPFSFLELIIFFNFPGLSYVACSISVLLQKRVSFFRIVETQKTILLNFIFRSILYSIFFLSFNFHDIIT